MHSGPGRLAYGDYCSLEPSRWGASWSSGTLCAGLQARSQHELGASLQRWGDPVPGPVAIWTNPQIIDSAEQKQVLTCCLPSGQVPLVVSVCVKVFVLARRSARLPSASDIRMTGLGPGHLSRCRCIAC